MNAFQEKWMELFRKILICICVVAVFFGAAVCVVVWPVALPEQREVLFEEEPAANERREAYEIEGVGGSRFFVQSPKSSALNEVFVSEFGADPDNEDNSEALNEAFYYCKENPGTRLVFEKGVYHVSDELLLEEVTDCCIDGNGAKIIHDYGGGLIDINECECLELRDLTIDWDWDKQPLGALARAVKVKGEKNVIDFVFDVPAYAREDMLYAISQCDEETGTYGAKGTFIESYDGQNPDVIKQVTKVGDDTLRVAHNGALERFAGHKFILRSTAYGGSVFTVRGSRDFTFYRLNLYGGTGMGIIVGEKSSHFALRDVFIGPDPKYADVRCVSLDADAVHINDAEGCFVIEDCDFSRHGDDDVNINCGIGLIERVDGRTVEVVADGSMSTEPGETIAFRDKKFHLINFTAVIESYEHTGYKKRRITFREELPAVVKKGGSLYNTECTGGNYVIRNNYFHEHRARGLLLQTSDGLVENNRFYKISHDALRIVMDIKDSWHEGTGADNIEIRNNTIVECGLTGVEVIEIGTHVNDKSSGSYAFTNIRIVDNVFSEICGNLMVINNVNGYVFSGNTITLGESFTQDIVQGRSYFLRDCANVELSKNTYTDVGPHSLVRLVRSDSPFVWARINGSTWYKEGAR